jgi:hypothetical protein
MANGIENSSVSDREVTERRFGPYWIVGAVCWSTVGNSMSPGSAIDAGGHEKVGQGTGHEQAMSVLVDPAVARLGKAEHPLDDPDRMLDPGPHFGLGTIFRRLDLVHNTAVAVAKVNEVLGLGGVLPDHGSLAAGKPDRPTRGSRCHATDRAALCCRRHWLASPQPRGSGWCGCRRQDAPSKRCQTAPEPHPVTIASDEGTPTESKWSTSTSPGRANSNRISVAVFPEPEAPVRITSRISRVACSGIVVSTTAAHGAELKSSGRWSDRKERF